MEQEEFKYKAGVLVIGSLLWDKENQRPEWRQGSFGENLNPIRVKVPVRYGRYSIKRECYTMVMSTSVAEGNAAVLPCINETASAEEIIAESHSLSKAEDSKDEDFLKGQNKKLPWCILVCWLNPSISEAKKQALLTRWKKEYRNGSFAVLQNHFKMEKEASAVFDESGALIFPWPDELKDFDVVMATQTKPRRPCDNCDRYPNPKEIAEYFYLRPQYFVKNWLSGIRTAEDEEIRQQIQQIDLLQNCRDADLTDEEIRAVFPDLKIDKIKSVG